LCRGSAPIPGAAAAAHKQPQARGFAAACLEGAASRRATHHFSTRTPTRTVSNKPLDTAANTRYPAPRLVSTPTPAHKGRQVIVLSY